MFTGAHLLSSDSASVTVWQASRDLPSGAVVADLRPVTVTLGAASEDYLPADEAVSGRILWPVAAGELVPRRAVVSGELSDARLVTIPVEPLRLPPEVMPGDRVDVWATPGDTGISIPELIVPDASIASVARENVGIGGQIAVVLTLAESDVAKVVAASRSGTLDLVAVPLASQSPDAMDLVEAADVAP